jgi:glycosyltransferase involved in cell wall biosynthesis
MEMPAVTLVIPAYNEEALLPALLESVQASVAEWAHGPASLEVIVANNCSTDRTSEVALGHGARVVDVPVRGIGSARNGGAAAARGDLLCFVDSDSRIHPRTFGALTAAMDRPGVGGGATGVIPERWSTPLRLLSAMTIPARIMGIDSGVVFCRRADFAAIGGYRGDLLVGEDVEFLWRLKLHARRQGRDLVRLKGVETITSTRKFDKHGHWRFLAALGGLAFHRAVSPRRFLRNVHRYWYEDR